MESAQPNPSKETPNLSYEIGFFENLSHRDPKDVRVLSVLAHLYTECGRITDGLRIDRRIVRHDPENPVAHYNLACSLALDDRPEDAVKSLRDAVDRGYADADAMLRDSDLDSLREYPPFLDLVREVANESGGGL